MPVPPQYQNAGLVENANFTAQVGASYTASNGDFVVYTPTAASVVNLPAVALGGPVYVVNLAAFTVTVKTTDSSTVQGVTGSTGYVVPSGGTGASSTTATFVSNGTSWYAVSH